MKSRCLPPKARSKWHFRQWQYLLFELCLYVNKFAHKNAWGQVGSFPKPGHLLGRIRLAGISSNITKGFSLSFLPTIAMN